MTTPNIEIPRSQWVDIYDLSGFEVGTSITIENISGSDMRISTNSTAPTDNGDDSGYRALAARTEENIRDGADGCFVWSNGQGVVNVYLSVPIIVGTGSNNTNRLQVDQGSTGFFEGRTFRVDYVVTAPVVIKVISPINFILTSQSLSSHDGISTMRAYRPEDGAEGGAFNVPANIKPNNIMDEHQPYIGEITAFTGGTFTPSDTDPNNARDYIKSKAATATAQVSTVGAGDIPERGLSAGIYYLVITGTDATFKFSYEERP